MEEEVGAVDYDVWVSDDKQEVLILKYARRFSKYKNCPKCEYKTYYLAHSKTLESPTYYSEGQHLKQHECKNCGYIKKSITTIPKLSQSSGGSSGGGFSSGGGGGGSSSWGGGSSGGGGAGVSW